LDALTAITTLQHVSLALPRLESVGPLAQSTGLQSLRLKSCSGLASLTGIEGATALTTVSISECPRLTDTQALANKPDLAKEGFGGSYEYVSYESSVFGYLSKYTKNSLDLTGAGNINNVEFIRSLPLIEFFRAKLADGVDLSPLESASAIKAIHLHLNAPGIALCGLANLDSLTLNVAHPPTSVAAMPNLTLLKLEGGVSRFHDCWPQLPKLKTLHVKQAKLTSLSWLDAPNLENVSLDSAMLEDCAGIGHAHHISMGVRQKSLIASVAQLANNPHIRWINTNSVDAATDLTPLATLPNLVSIHAGTNKAIYTITEIDTVKWLSLSGSAGGSLSFLKGWSALEILVLTNTGDFTGLDVVAQLPALRKIQLRGSSTKRDQWPEVLQEKLDYVSATSATEFKMPTS